MDWTVFHIAEGTPFFHGTQRAVEVIRNGVKPSFSTPDSRRITGLRWYVASFTPALRYTDCSDGLPAVIEFRASRPFRLADLRPYTADPFDRRHEPSADEVARQGFDGVVICGTSGGGDLEYGFVSGALLEYVGYRLVPDAWQIAEEGKALYQAQPDRQRSQMRELRRLKQDSLRAKIEAGLSAKTNPS